MTDRFLPGVPAAQVEAIFNAAPGNEISTGKFDSPESSAALAANTFGFFLNRPGDMPPLPGCGHITWPAHSVNLERTVRFPWRGGRHPVLDVLITTPSALIGIESKRFEPFESSISDTFWREVWGDRMRGYERVRDKLYRRDKGLYAHLNATQLIKHALALRAQVNLRAKHHGLTPILMYLYAEPNSWPNDGRPVREEMRARHREEIADFARRVSGDEVKFIACSYRELLSGWQENESPKIRAHAEAVIQSFAP